MDDAVGRAALVGRDLPAVRGRGNQHRAGLGPQLTVLLERVRDRGGTARHLQSKDRVPIDIRSGRELGRNLRPVGVHLIGEDHRQRSVHALAELETIDHDHDPAVWSDVDKRIGRKNFRRRRLISSLRERRKIDVQGNQQPARGGSRCTQEASPVQMQISCCVECRSHGPPRLL